MIDGIIVISWKLVDTGLCGILFCILWHFEEDTTGFCYKNTKKLIIFVIFPELCCQMCAQHDHVCDPRWLKRHVSLQKLIIKFTRGSMDCHASRLAMCEVFQKRCGLNSLSHTHTCYIHLFPEECDLNPLIISGFPNWGH